MVKARGIGEVVFVKDAIKFMLIPIIGVLGIGLIFLAIVWAGNYKSKIENVDGKYSSASKDLGGYAVMMPTYNCDDSYFPVCGFDGKTYDNTCLALKAGTKVSHRGVCQA